MLEKNKELKLLDLKKCSSVAEIVQGMNQYPEERGILKSAYEHQVPVFVPAFHDSELGNDVYLDNHVRKNQGRQPILFNLELDTEFLLNMMTNSPKIGIFTIGGGAKEKLSALKAIAELSCLTTGN